MVKVRKRKVRSSAYHTKSYTIEEIVSIPYEYICEKCKEKTSNEYKIRKHAHYTVIKEKTGENEFVELPLPKEVEEKTYEKFDKSIQNEVELLKKQTAKGNFNMLNDALCGKCRASQSWNAKYNYVLNIIFSLVLSLLILICGCLVGLVLKGALFNLARSIKITFIKQLLENGVLLGAIIGFICAFIYFIKHLTKQQNIRFEIENVEKKEIPSIHFDQIKIEKKTYELLKEDRLN